MWAKAIRSAALGALAALAAWACGCQASGYFMNAFQPEAAARKAPPAPAPAAVSPETNELNEAILLISQLQYKEAAGMLLNLIPRLAGSDDHAATAEATFWLGYCREKQQRPAEAAQFYKKVVEDYRQTPAAKMAEERLKALPG